MIVEMVTCTKRTGMLLTCTWIALTFCFSVVQSRPIAHSIEKRATRAEILGDLTAGQSGILNEKGTDENTNAINFSSLIAQECLLVLILSLYFY